MTAWHDVEQAEPEFARRVRALFDAHRHKTIATLRADGSPRISGIEAVFEDGELVFGSMPDARKGADLRRDPRFALHSATVDPVEGSEAQWPGEAKISGRAIAAGPVTEGPDGDRFHADIAEVVHTHLNEAATLLVVEWWTPGRGLRRIDRELDRFPERPHVDRAVPGDRVLGRHLDSLLQAGAFQDVKPADLLLGLGERAIGDQYLAAAHADRPGVA
jgi:Pyridoxamine 5'-phosphate oxidase